MISFLPEIGHTFIPDEQESRKEKEKEKEEDFFHRKKWENRGVIFIFWSFHTLRIQGQYQDEEWYLPFMKRSEE